MRFTSVVGTKFNTLQQTGNKQATKRYFKTAYSQLSYKIIPEESILALNTSKVLHQRKKVEFVL